MNSKCKICKRIYDEVEWSQYIQFMKEPDIIHFLKSEKCPNCYKLGEKVQMELIIQNKSMAS